LGGLEKKNGLAAVGNLSPGKRKINRKRSRPVSRTWAEMDWVNVNEKQGKERKQK
jgi:hypothetical protein